MTRHASPFSVRLAESASEVEAAQALRYRVFVEEKGARAGMGCDRLRREWDRFDSACEHLVIRDELRGGCVVGAARLMDETGAARVGGFPSEAEFDLGALRRSGRRLLELGRTCLDPAARGGAALHSLWAALARISEERRVGAVFGLASLPGTDPAALAEPLAFLGAEHLAPPGLRPVSRRPVPMAGPYSRRTAVLALPPLVKGYLRLGGRVGEGGCVDPDFGCTDVCVVLDASALVPGARLGPPPCP